MDNENGNGSLRDAIKRIPPLAVDLDDEVRRIRTQPQRVSEFAPPTADPVRLASLTIKSVHKIGADSATEIREVADLILKGAQEVASNLHDLANAVAGHSDVAHQHMAEFGRRTTNLLVGVRALTEAFNAQNPVADASAEAPAAGLVANNYPEPST